MCVPLCMWQQPPWLVRWATLVMHVCNVPSYPALPCCCLWLCPACCLILCPATHARPPADFKPVQRELVIDIDMTDYDELRTCGSGGHICSRCWPFIAVAIQVRRCSNIAGVYAQSTGINSSRGHIYSRVCQC